jgi:3-hydroxyacyl-CoA dehydrogenase / enoyl-CoA hydratase / 3-hydroxybutyryl-CoA epimerase
VANVTVEIQSDGVAVIAIDVADSSMNAFSRMVIEEIRSAFERAASDPAVRGVLITSAKKAFAAGADLHQLLALMEQRFTLGEAYDGSRYLSDFLRRLETCGKPVACAINGLALGGGFEIALACHYRVLSSDPSAFVGLPEVKVGLLPGAGGTQRLPRLIGINAALPLLLDGLHVPPPEALRMGLVHELADPAQTIAAARRWLLSGPTATQPWDRKGFAVPGGAGIADPGPALNLMGATARGRRATLDNYPARQAILCCVYEGLQVPMDTGLKIEGRYFAQLMTGTVAPNIVRSLFINKGQADKLVRRPKNIPKGKIKKLGVLGSGMMGSGIAYVSALSGMDCVLLDRTQAQAEAGKAYGARLLEKEVARGSKTRADADTIVARVKATTAFADLADCDLIVEAVFEDRAVKAQVTAQTEEVIPAACIFATNTSTIPISSLATSCKRPERFIGIHFFSPVERMPLVEIIVGKQSLDATLALALDFVGQLRKTPIVVNDSRGFYTSRVFGVFWCEGQMMLNEGIAPALIENAARFAGMPIGPLAVSDEVSLELQYRTLRQSASDLGDAYQYPVAWGVLRHFVKDLKRLGRKAGGGFYEYPPGAKKHLWDGLAHEYPASPKQPTVQELKTRFLYIQSLETARCLEEGVLSSAIDADIGSILGWGFPSYTGGTLSLIDTVGAAHFVAECKRMSDLYGPRFAPTVGLLERVSSGALYHPRHSSTGALATA